MKVSKLKTINNQSFDEERALYNLTDALVENCVFAGPADGESALKEARNVAVKNCTFSLRYPFWHTTGLEISGCTLDDKTRASLWYVRDAVITDTQVSAVKCLRECDGITLKNFTAVSPEFGWRCRNIKMNDCDITSEYFMFEAKNVDIDSLKMKGKYSFQYIEDMTVKNSTLDTKDAFWHTKNVTVENCTIKGEYLAWYSDGLTLIDCHIIGTQPLCYCKNLRLVNCTMENTDLAFEYSEVDADVKGEIMSVKNPHSGKIVADGYGEIILDNSVMSLDCEIKTR